jgi:eukaryotic-like serine/threonine-protein kinase
VNVPEIDPLLGTTLVGRYELLSTLGSGSWGDVYRARDRTAGRDVAVKVLRCERMVDQTATARFTREARAMSLLASPHTVQVLDFGYSDPEGLFLVMELLRGESLRKRLTRVGRLAKADAIEVCRHALRSLAEAHAKGIVHRDLKPDHLFFARDASMSSEVLKVLDFGAAKMVGAEAGSFNAVETREGKVLGTPRYMSPEQAQGRRIDARCDLYALGVILYQMLTGRPPFDGDKVVLVMAQHVTQKPAPPSVVCPEAAIPPELDAVVLRALAKDPAARYASAEAMADALERALGSTRDAMGMALPARSTVGDAADLAQTVEEGAARPRRRRRGFVVAAGAAVVAFAALAAAAWPRPLEGQARAMARAVATASPGAIVATNAVDSSPVAERAAAPVPVEALPQASPPPTSAGGATSKRPLPPLRVKAKKKKHHRP